jgi:hypothetical protein
MGGSPLHSQRQLASGYQFVELCVGASFHGVGRDDLAVSHDSETISDGAYLFHAMRNIDDGLAGISKPQAVTLLRRQARRGLVECDDTASSRQGPADLDELTISHAELGDGCVDSKMRRERLENVDSRLAMTLARDNVQTRRLAEKDVLRHVKLRNEAEFLADKSDAKRQRMTGALDLNDAEGVDFDLSRIWRDDAEQNLHQRRFARAVLAEKCVDLATLECEIHVVQHARAAKGLGHAAHRRHGRA